MWLGVDITTTYHAFMNIIDISMQSLLDSVRKNKKANGRGSVMWADVVAIAEINCQE